MPKPRVHNFAMSVDGYVAGSDQSVDNPLGVGGEQLHDWMFRTPTARPLRDIDVGRSLAVNEE